MKTLKLLIIGLGILCLKPSFAHEKAGALIGVVSDLENMETLPFVNVVIKDIEGNIIAGGSSDFDGAFNINPIAPGQYTIEASFTGYETEVFKQIEIKGGEKTKLDILLIEENFELMECVIIEELPLIECVTRWCCFGGVCTNVIYALGEDKIANQSFALFPNPSSGEFNLRTEEKIDHVFITNMNGQTVAEIATENLHDISTDLSHLPAATYVVHYSDGRSRISQFWILQH